MAVSARYTAILDACVLYPRLQAKKPRPVLRRLALYVAMLLTGPVIIGASLWATFHLLAASSALVGTRPAWMPHALNLGPVVLGAAGFACLFRFVPHTAVRWRDAIAGGLLAGIAFEFGKRGFAIYLANVPTYRTIYGAFAPLLAFLVWVYYSWFITLAAALVSASLPRAGGAGGAAAVTCMIIDLIDGSPATSGMCFRLFSSFASWMPNGQPAPRKKPTRRFSDCSASRSGRAWCSKS